MILRLTVFRKRLIELPYRKTAFFFITAPNRASLAKSNPKAVHNAISAKASTWARRQGAVRIETEVELSYLERLFIKDVAEENRTRGVSLANDICKNYRRQGLFFDEIFEQAKNGEEYGRAANQAV